MLKLKLKSLKYALPYLAICLIFVIDQWNYSKGIIHMYMDGELTKLTDDMRSTLIGMVACTVIIIVTLVLIFSGKCQKSIYKHIQNSNLPQFEREKVERFLAEAPYIYNLQYDKDFLCCRNCTFTVFIETRNVVRIVKRKQIHRYKLILPIFKSNYLVFITADRKQKTISFKREKHADEALEVLKGICPWAVK